MQQPDSIQDRILRTGIHGPLLVVGYLAIVWIGLYQKFGADDTGIMLLLQSGTPVRFTGQLFSELLIGLYRIAPSVPWYPLALCVGHFVSLCLLTWALRHSTGSTAFRFGVGAFYLASYARFALELHYNSASILLAMHAILCLSVALRKERVRSSTLVLLGLACALGFELRSRGLVAALAFSWPLIALAMAQQGPARWRRVAIFAGVLLAVVGLDVSVRQLGLSDDVRAYFELDRSRGRVNQTGIVRANEGNSALLRANGWSQNDYRLLAGWFLVDETRFNQETFTRLRLQAKPRDAGYLAEKFATQLRQRAGDVAIMFVLVGVAFVLRGRRSGTMALAYALYCVLAIVAMVALLRFPPRIGDPLSLGMLGGLMLIALNPPGVEAGRRRGLRIALGMALAGIALLALDEAVRKSEWAGERNRLYTADVALLNAELSGGVVLFQSGATLPWSFTRPFAPAKLEFAAIRTGWLSYSPPYVEAAAKLGAQRPSEILPRMIDHPRAALVAWPAFVPSVGTYLEEAHGLRATAVQIDRLSSGAGVYRLRASPPPPG